MALSHFLSLSLDNISSRSQSFSDCLQVLKQSNFQVIKSPVQSSSKLGSLSNAMCVLSGRERGEPWGTDSRDLLSLLHRPSACSPVSDPSRAARRGEAVTGKEQTDVTNVIVIWLWCPWWADDLMLRGQFGFLGNAHSGHCIGSFMTWGAPVGEPLTPPPL